MLDFEELKQVFREQEQEQDKTEQELKTAKIRLAKLKEQEQELKNAKLLAEAEERERIAQQRHQKNKSGADLTTIFALVTSLAAAIVPFIALIIVFIKF